MSSVKAVGSVHAVIVTALVRKHWIVMVVVVLGAVEGAKVAASIRLVSAGAVTAQDSMVTSSANAAGVVANSNNHADDAQEPEHVIDVPAPGCFRLSAGHVVELANGIVLNADVPVAYHVAATRGELNVPPVLVDALVLVPVMECTAA